MSWIFQLISTFNLFLLLFISLTTLFYTINESHCTIQFIFATTHGSHYTILTNFYIYLQYFQQKNFSFSKISESQIDPKCAFGMSWIFQLISTFNLFLLLFMGLTALFCTIYGSRCTIQLTFTFIYSTFSKKFLISAK